MNGALNPEKACSISNRYFSYILRGQRRPSPELAKRLERATGIDRRAWLWPDEFPNPMMQQSKDSPSAAEGSEVASPAPPSRQSRGGAARGCEACGKSSM